MMPWSEHVADHLRLRRQLGFKLTWDEHVLGQYAAHLDATGVEADLVVFATGYGSMNGWAADLISPDAAGKVGKVWGFGSGTTKDPGPWGGEQRNMWKPTQQEALWFHGGNLALSRYYFVVLGDPAQGSA